ncbi:hypothetical protein [Bradyrhizobium sp. SEMIA]|uniref:hypothetical protein n=1 Tax=Bradyrhizobium sp. SEMIA TaxID=2597515 RepID=UPI0018A665DC|nr:hypothetical protein [Bradyrhizobium sp. SEMIA]QOG20429.1 hypothetical protein FOM02_26840 [Bradyrhizobium sp. SEMIA]
MNDVERQILLNHIAILEAMIAQAAPISRGPGSTVDILRQRYRETAELVRQYSPNKT